MSFTSPQTFFRKNNDSPGSIESFWHECRTNCNLHLSRLTRHRRVSSPRPSRWTNVSASMCKKTSQWHLTARVYSPPQTGGWIFFTPGIMFSFAITARLRLSRTRSALKTNWLAVFQCLKLVSLLKRAQFSEGKLRRAVTTLRSVDTQPLS